MDESMGDSKVVLLVDQLVAWLVEWLVVRMVVRLDGQWVVKVWKWAQKMALPLDCRWVEKKDMR